MKATSFEGKEFEVTENPDKVDSGTIVETFKISVTTTDEDTKETTVHYKNDNEPFVWEKVSSFPAVLTAHGAKLSDDAIAFLGEALGGEENGKAVASLIEQHNQITR